MLFIRNFLTFISCLAPIVGLLIDNIPLRKRWLFLFEFLFLGLAIFLMSGAYAWAAPGTVNPLMYSFVLGFYPLMMAVMLPVLSLKYEFSRALALTFMLGFLFTELHEIVGFGKLYLGWFDNSLAKFEYWAWFTPLNHLYSVVVAALALKISRFQRKWIPLGLCAFLLGIVLEIWIYPNLAYGVYDIWDFARRVVWLPIILLIFMKGGKKVESQHNNSP